MQSGTSPPPTTVATPVAVPYGHRMGLAVGQAPQTSLDVEVVTGKYIT